MKQSHKGYVPPKEKHKRTTIWIYDDTKTDYNELTEYMGSKQHVVDAIGRMILEGQFDYKEKKVNPSNINKKSASGNYILFKEVKKAAKDLGYKVTELINTILKNNKSDVLNKINEIDEPNFRSIYKFNDLSIHDRNIKTKVWLYSDEVINNYEELTQHVQFKQHVIDIIGQMIIEGQFDYLDKSDETLIKAQGNYLLFSEVKLKSEKLGYSMSELFNDILKNNKDEVFNKLDLIKKDQET